MEQLRLYVKENYKKVIGWGTGGYYDKYKNELPVKLDYLIDSNTSKHGKLIDGIPVFSPNQLVEENCDEVLIVIFSTFFREIVETIYSYGKFSVVSGDQFVHLEPVLNNDKLTILSEEDKKKTLILSVSRNNYTLYLGGTSKFISEQMSSLTQLNYLHLHIFWRSYSIKGYQGNYITVVKDGQEIGIYSEQEFKKQVSVINACIIHNVIGMDMSVLRNVLDYHINTIPIYYYLHDFSSICSDIKMIYNDGYNHCFSYDKDWVDCASCTQYKDKQQVYSKHSKLFALDNVTLIAPSENTKNIFMKSFNFSPSKIEVILHQTFEHENFTRTMDVNSKVKIAYVGYKNKYKGWEQFKQLYSKFQGKYEFYCFGLNDEVIDGIHYIDVSFIEDGELAMVRKLQEYEIDIAFLWSTWPETYSYTYYESYAAGCFIVTHEFSGNIADQVRLNQNGLVLSELSEFEAFLLDENNVRISIQESSKKISNLTSNVSGFINLLSYKTNPKILV